MQRRIRDDDEDVFESLILPFFSAAFGLSTLAPDIYRRTSSMVITYCRVNSLSSRHRCRLSAAKVDNPWLSIFFRALLNQTLLLLLLVEWAFSEPINEIIFHRRAVQGACLQSNPFNF